ncbi:MAG TPA: hypothetical protein VE046_09940 [Steroidobacteraceae bacterium]|nr:hypothetical protein [Steroidobacteraceae bacterium]
MRDSRIATFALAASLAAGLAAGQDTAPKAPAPATQAPAPAAKPTPTPATAAEPAVQTSPSAKPAAKPGADGKRFKTVDKMELDATAVTGNRELPKVLYIVPWKKADLGDLVGKPMNSLVDEVLAPVDRDVFKRQLRYYGALQPDKAGAAASTESKPEK